MVVTDVAMPRLHRLTPDYLTALEAAARDAIAVVASHPYTYDAIRAVSDAPLWYEAQDVEAALKHELLREGDFARELLSEVEATERRCCEDASVIWACSDEDRSELVRRYSTDPGRILVVPNGVSLEDVTFVGPNSRAEFKRQLRLTNRFVALFLASWHPPNVLAARRLVDLASAQPELEFLILGSVGAAIDKEPLPQNVSLTGTISAEHKRAVLSVVDVAVNPVTTGSGTNIKMLDYFASGTPVVSTTFGARGLGVSPDCHYFAADAARFGEALNVVHNADVDRLEPLVARAREHVEQTLSWTAIASQLLDELTRLDDLQVRRSQTAHEPRMVASDASA